MSHYPLLLLLEQDLDDQTFLETLLADFRFKKQIRFFRKNDDLLQFLRSFQGKALILLDFNTYPESALEMLPVLKNDPYLSIFPVIVLGESSHPSDIHKCYQLGASSYIVKSSDMQEIRSKVNIFSQYWFEVVAI